MISPLSSSEQFLRSFDVSSCSLFLPGESTCSTALPTRSPPRWGNITLIKEINVYGPYQESVRIWVSPSKPTFSFGEKITLEAGADFLPYSGSQQRAQSFKWRSSLDGELGNGDWISTSTFRVGTHIITLECPDIYGNLISTSTTIVIGDEVAKIKIKNLDAPAGIDPFAENASVSYRAAKTRFQAIGYRVDGSEVGPVPVDWEIQGGEVVASEQLRMGILNHLGQVNTRIGNIENSPFPVPGGSIFPILDSPQVTFHSFLPGNITLAARKGTASGYRCGIYRLWAGNT